MIKTTKNARNVTKERKKQGRCFIAKLQGHVSILKREDRIMICDKWLHIYGNKLGTGVNCEWVDDVRENVRGEWIPHRLKSREYIGTVLVSVDYDYWFCDTCGYRVENGQPMYNYCPNCGADMRGDNNEMDSMQ